MEMHLADLFEATVDLIPNREILVVGEERRTLSQLEERANQMAHYLLSIGVKTADHVGIYAYNSVQWVESMLACYKIRAIPINVNYRYVEDELLYLCDNADMVAMVFESQFCDRLVNIKDKLPKLKTYVSFDEGSHTDCAALGAVEFEDAMKGQSTARDFEARSEDDVYVLYTGGTTGMPKGVMWRMFDCLHTLGGALDPISGEPFESAEAMMERIDTDEDGGITQMPLAPLMHGAAQWACMNQMLMGNRIIMLPGSFEAKAVLKIIEKERVNALTFTGDATGIPLSKELATGDYDLSSIDVLISTGAICSADTKVRFLEANSDLVILDCYGASEQGLTGMRVYSDEDLETLRNPSDDKETGLTIEPGGNVTILDPDTLTPLKAGDGKVGLLARGGYVPLGYYKDPEKSAKTFIDVNGERFSIAGDMGRIEEDGRITLYGRGSNCINSGGEKIFPEEVEGALKNHPDIFDVLVVGLKDERWGQRVSAVIQVEEGKSLSMQSMQDVARKHVSGYKVPREMHIVPKVERAPNGKPDYKWAKAAAESGEFKVG